MVSSLFRRIEGGLGSGLYVCACAGQCTPRFDLPQMAARRGKDKPDAPVPIITDGSLAKENGPAAKIESRSGASERPGALATPGQPIFGRIAHLRNSAINFTVVGTTLGFGGEKQGTINLGEE
jgi:hypothetical protein